jgi:hypothetical protein
MNSLSLHHPFTALSSGPSGCGKSWLIRDLLLYRNDMFEPPPKKVVWFYGIFQSLYHDIPNVTFVEGIPDRFEDYLEGPTLFIFDDLMAQCGKNTRMTDLFTKGSHHLNLSVIFITQNLFHKGKEMREISLNAHYLFLFKNRRDMSQLTHLGRQLYPCDLKFFQQVYQDATSNPYSYLLVDLRPETPEPFRLRTNILPTQHPIIYQKRY